MLPLPPSLRGAKRTRDGKEEALRDRLFVLSIIIDLSSSEGEARKAIPKKTDYRTYLPMYVLW